MRRTPLVRVMLLGQGAYYAVTGLWPLIHMRSFEAISGPKRDQWLVKTIGLLLTAFSSVLLLAGMRRQPQLDVEVSLAAAGNAAALAATDVIFTAQRRISPAYLLDALAEVVLLAGWIAVWRTAGRAKTGEGEE